MGIKSFFDTFGWGFCGLVGSGLLIACLIEIIIKKPADWLEKKWAGHPRFIAVLQGAKVVVTQIIAWVLSVWFALLVCKVLPLPGGEVLIPLWTSLAYISQFVFSCFGIKGILALIKKHSSEKAKEVEVERDPFEGMEKLSENLWQDKNTGHYYTTTKKGGIKAL